MYQQKRLSAGILTAGSSRLVNSIKLLLFCMLLTVVPAVADVLPAKAPAAPADRTSATPAGSGLVQPGDQADIHFTCRFKSGELAISTYQDPPEGSSRVKSGIFLPRDRNTPLSLTAGRDTKEPRTAPPRGFEGEVVHQLTNAIIGLPIGEKKTVEIQAEKFPEGKPGEYAVKMARVRKRPKAMRMTPEEYRTRTGKAAEAGQLFTHDPALPGKVVSVNEAEVAIRFEAEKGKEVETPFGKGTISETPDEYRIVISADVGSLVRTGGFIGRIAAVDEAAITVDYSHAFGGEALLCGVTVESAKAGRADLPTTAAVLRSAVLDAQAKELADTKAGKAATRPDAAIEEGDLAKVNYTVTLDDGALVYSTWPHVAKDGARKKAIGYTEPETFGPEEVIAGKPAKFSGVGESVAGMTVGKKKAVRIPGDSAFVQPDPGKIRAFPTVWTSPRMVRLPPAEFLTRFQVLPAVGKEVQFTPFLKAAVREVDDKVAVLELIVKSGEKHTEEFGAITIGLGEKGDEVVATLVPIVGAAFRTGSAEGRITGFDGKSFTVDFSSPLAGRAVVLDIEVAAVTKASDLAGMQIPWIEDHDKGLLAAKEAGKPAVMLLYADWCSWCKKLQNETFPDPRIKVLKDRLTFVRVNSDKRKDVQKKYGQKGFPLVILFNRKGEIAGRIDGYKDAAGLRRELDGLIDGGAAG